jgi:enediyne biosynthesis protein E4
MLFLKYSRLPRVRLTSVFLAALTMVALLAGAGCGPREVGADKGDKTPSKPPDPIVEGPPFFEEVTRPSGIDMTYHNGEEAGRMAILESVGGGIALFDYDGDGLLDVYIPGGGLFKDKEILGLPGKLYRNLGDWKFQDVTKEAGLNLPLFYSHGAAVADFDNDGWPDLLISGWNGVALFHNEPDGKGGRRFVDVTRKAGLTDGWHWATSAAWADLDGDGFPDLYVCQYGNWSFANHPTDCTYDGKTRDICPPRRFQASPHRLFRNNGNGTFTEATRTCCIDKNGKTVGLRNDGKGLAVLMVDVNADGKPDVYVANDTDDKFLYMNRSKAGKLILEEKGLAMGVACDERGTPNGSMGLDASDYNHTGRPSLWVTNYENELHALYRNDCKGENEDFHYITQKAGLAVLGNTNVGWGTRFLDVDLDGWEDLMIAHGHVILHPPSKSPRRQMPVLMRNTGGKFVVATQQGGSYFQKPHNARGVAMGDLNNRGRTDLVISHLNEPVEVLKNVAETNNHWLGLDLAGEKNRDVVGARIEVEIEGAKLTHFARGGGSYASTSDRRHLIGLGTAAEVKRVTVHWPWSDKPQVWEGLKPDRYWRLKEGDAKAEEVNYNRRRNLPDGKPIE